METGTFKEIGHLSNFEIQEMVRKEIFKRTAGIIDKNNMIVEFEIESRDAIDELVSARVLIKIKE